MLLAAMSTSMFSASAVIIIIILCYVLQSTRVALAQSKEASSNEVKYNKNCECGLRPNGADTRIVGGTVTEPHVYPWMVAILYRDKLHCGGSLINDRYVLTAAHCMEWWIKTNELALVLGMHDRLTDEKMQEVVQIDRVITHENFTNGDFCDTQDIALIKLREPVVYGAYVSPVCLPQKPSENFEGKRGIVSGWGHTSTSDDLSRYLRETYVMVMEQESCMNTTVGPHILDSMICAYGEHKDACQGDSGGPLFFEETPDKLEQIGIVSWGIGCAKPNTPGVYTRVTSFLPWILDNTEDATYCQQNNSPLEDNN